MTKQNEFIESHGGELTAEQAAQLLELEEGRAEGDTGLEPELEVKPDTPTPSTAGEADDPKKTVDDGTSAVDESTLTAENAVILAKDQKHTISYNKLLEARKAEQHWREQAEAAQSQLAKLQAEALARSEAGVKPTATDSQVAVAQAAIDEGVDPDLFGDFSEKAMAEGISKLVNQRVAARVEAAVSRMEAVVGKQIEPLRQVQEQSAHERHFQEIYTAHPDADSVVESKELSDWINAQPAFLHGTYTAILESGSAKDVIALFDAFKQANGATQVTATPSEQEVRDAAKKVIQSAKAAPPASLSDIPGGRAGGQTVAERMASITDGRELLDVMDGMTPEQIEDHLNRLI